MIGRTHVADEVEYLEIGDVAESGHGLVHFVIVEFAGLPDELHLRGLDLGQVVAHALVDGARAEAAAHKQNGLLVGGETELAPGLLAGERRGEHVLTHGVSGHDNLVGREESLHALVGYAYLGSLLGQQPVGDPGVAVLLLDEAGDAALGTHVEGGAAGIAANTHGRHGTEVFDDVLGHALAFPNAEKHGDVFQQVLAIEAADGQPLNLVACRRHALHLHASECTDNQNLGIGMLGLDGIGNGDGREDVASGTASADDDSQFVVHLTLFIFGKSNQKKYDLAIFAPLYLFFTLSMSHLCFSGHGLRTLVADSGGTLGRAAHAEDGPDVDAVDDR